MLNYPIKFTPILKEKIWGGTKLISVLNKFSEEKNLGESWEISGVEKNVSVVANGPLKGKNLNELIEEYKEEFLGKKIFEKFTLEFPLLIKFIDASSPLSVQVHPNDSIAKQRHNSLGKTEMWYIMQADEKAEINIGFNQSISREEYLQKLEAGEITKILNYEKVRKGDSYLIKTGKVHAIGAGVLLAEIQQTSDITYRIYDWDRKDEQGNPRELHTSQALEAIDFQLKDDFKLQYSSKDNQPSNIVNTEYFVTNFISVKGKISRNHNKLDSFVIYICVSGNAEISIGSKSENISRGQTVLIPAINKKLIISAENAELLEVYIQI